MTGRGFGYCALPYPSRYFGAGVGRRMGRGCGMGGAAWGQGLGRTEKEFLEEERDMLKARLKAIEEELDDE